MEADTGPANDSSWRGRVRLIGAAGALGFLHVILKSADDTWGGRVTGSDYLLWGTNLARSEIEFPTGEQGEVVLRSGGRLQGLGPVPAILSPESNNARSR